MGIMACYQGYSTHTVAAKFIALPYIVIAIYPTSSSFVWVLAVQGRPKLGIVR
jgi:hypothetical protein